MASFFSNLFGGGDSEEAAKAGQAMRTAAGAGAKTALNTATDKASSYYTGANEWLDPSYEAANRGNKAYSAAIGLGTPQEQEAQFQSFYNSPGVKYALDEGANQNVRLAALTGDLGSSRTAQRINDSTANKLSTGYSSWVDKMLPYVTQAPQIAGQKAGVSVGQGNLFPASATTSGGWDIGIANANAQSEMDAAAAKQRGAANLMQAIMGAAKLAGNVIAPGSGALMDMAGSAAASGATGGQGYGTGNRGSTWW